MQPTLEEWRPEWPRRILTCKYVTQLHDCVLNSELCGKNSIHYNLTIKGNTPLCRTIIQPINYSESYWQIDNWD